MTPIAEFIRKPKGTTETYLLPPGEESYFLKKMATYALRAKARVAHDVWLAVRLSDDTVQRMIVVKVLKPGKKLKKRGRKSHGS